MPRQQSADGEAPTVRTFLPWHFLESRDDIGDTEAEARLPVPHDSGIRISSQESADGLSYKVYSLAELERRSLESVTFSPVRASMMIGITQERTPSPWKRVGSSAYAMLYAAKLWATARVHRPLLADALQAPGVVFVADLRAALATVRWKKVGFGTAAGLVTALALLFFVLTVAELTDDLKPAHSETPLILIPTAEARAIATAPAPVAPPIVVAAPEPPAVVVVTELDPEPSPPLPPKPRTMKTARAPKPEVEIFTP